MSMLRGNHGIDRAHFDTAPVAQASKPAVSQVSKPAVGPQTEHHWHGCAGSSSANHPCFTLKPG